MKLVHSSLLESNYVSKIISFGNLLININSNENCILIKKDINEKICSFIDYFSGNELTEETLSLYLFQSNLTNINMIQRLQETEDLLKETVIKNKSTLIFDLEEQYFSIKKTISRYESFQDGLFRQKLNNIHLEKSFHELEQSLKKIREIFEPHLTYRRESIRNYIDISNLSDIKDSINELEQKTLQYKKFLCQTLGFSIQEWNKKFSLYCEHLIPISDKDLDTINKGIKRFLTRVQIDKDCVFDSFAYSLNDNLFKKVKRQAINYATTFGISHIGNRDDSIFYKKLLNEQFTFGLINMWEQNCIDFSNNIANSLLKELSLKGFSFSRIDFSMALDAYMENNTNLQQHINKSIKEIYKKSESNILEFDFRTAFLSMNEPFNREIQQLFIQKVNNNLNDLGLFIQEYIDNSQSIKLLCKEQPIVEDESQNIFAGLTRKPKIN